MNIQLDLKHANSNTQTTISPTMSPQAYHLNTPNTVTHFKRSSMHSWFRYNLNP